MKKKFDIGLFISTILFSSSLFATDNILDIDSLLDDIENKTDLSEKTKLENSGISFIYTRNDLERMQVRYLKDILKSGSIFGYTENRYGLPDPLTQGDSIPFMSSSIRIFIDNQEVMGGMYGSGLILYGDLDIRFVDHIEIYTQSPTYEYSTEPTIMLIKLYSKTALKDEGTKLEITASSYDSTRLEGYTSRELNGGWSYFSYISNEQLNRKHYDSFDTDLSRDRKVTHIFTSLKNKNNHINIDFVRSQKDGFAGPSLDATPIDTTLKANSFHIGYDTNIDNFSFLVAYDYLGTKNYLEDDQQPIESRDVNTVSKIVSTELKYKKKIDEHSLIIGAKYRYKKYYFDKYILNGEDVDLKDNEQQDVANIFAEDQYFVMQNLIFTTGIQGVFVSNKDALYNKNSNLLLYRTGLTYLLDNFIFKTVASHSEAFLEPYLVDSSLIEEGNIKNSRSDTIYEDIIYQSNINRYEAILGYQINENYLLPNDTTGVLSAQEDDLKAFLAILRWETKYNQYDKFFSEVSYMNIKNLGDIDRLKIYKFVLRNLNTIGKFDIFNEIIFDRDNKKQKNFYDYSAGVIYHYKNNFNLSLKAENIFDKASETSYLRIDPSTKEQETSLEISPIDPRVTFSMEYMF